MLAHRRAASTALVLLAMIGAAPPARADENELAVSVRPTYGVAWISEDGTTALARVRGRGLVGGVNLGLRDWLDLGAEVLTDSFGAASYQEVTLPISGNLYRGPLRRISRRSQLRALVTFRTGVAWMPFVQLGLGAGARHRTSALLMVMTAVGDRWIVPDGQGEEITIDVSAGARVGIERRLAVHWLVGVSAAASHTIGLLRPDLQTAEVTLSLAYQWYLARDGRPRRRR